MIKSKNFVRRTADISPRFFRAMVLFLALAVFSSLNASAQALVPINRIQGDGNISPMVGKQVATRGIVTFVGPRGFYIQTPDNEADNDPKTSEGIYVFTNQQIPPGAVVGNLVEVTGTVTEYMPRNERYFLSITEITRPTVKVVSKNNPLPAAITLTANDLNPKGKIDQLERFEGMRVKIDALEVVAPTGGYQDRKTGVIKSDGVFYGVIAGTPRPFREPGISGLIWLVEKMPQSVPVFDMNPELLRVDSDVQENAKAIDVTAGATVKNLTGVIDYSRRAYTLLVDQTNPPTVEGNKTFTKASPAGERETTVAMFNLENFFDDEKNSDNVEREEILSKEHFQNRLNKASLAIRNVLSMPDVLGVTEVENLKVLKKLAEKINADAVAANQPNPKYEAYLEEGNDIRGIDVGFLVKTSKVKTVEVKQLGKDEKLETEGARPGEKLHDRPPLLIRVEVQDEKTGQPFPLTVIVNHFKSYGGIDDPKDGNRVRNKRRLQAEWLAKYVFERQKENPSERIIVGGDLNAFQFNDGYNDLVGILKGNSNQNVLVPAKTQYQTGLINPAEFIDAKNRYSYVFEGSAQILDHILINKPTAERALKFGFARLNADFPKVYANDPTRPERLSDHDAPIIYLSLDEVKKK
jgi:Predicted extracellular nuclease